MRRNARAEGGFTAEAAPARSPTRLEDLLEDIDEAFFSYDREWRILYLNRRAARLLGRPREALLGRVVWEVFPHGVGSRLHRELLQAMEAQAPRDLVLRNRATGAWRHFRLHPTPEGLSVFCREGAARPGAREPAPRREPTPRPAGEAASADSHLAALRRVERAQRFLAEAGKVLAGSLDLEATFERLAALVVPDLADCCAVGLLDDGVLRHVAVAPRDAATAERLGARLRHAFDPPGGSGVRRVLRISAPAVVTDEADAWLAEAPSASGSVPPRRDGASIMVVPLEAHGQNVGAMVLARLGGARPYAQPDLELATRLADRAALALANAQSHAHALAATRLRDEVLGFVAHDLRNPLAAVTLYAQRLQKLSPAGCGPEIEGILRSTARASRLTHDLLDLARAGAGRLALDLRPERLASLVDEAIALQLYLAEERSLRLTRELAADLPDVRLDRHRVLQVLANLLDNAIKYAPPGAAIRVRVERADDGVRVAVRDTGPGIPREDLPRLFDHFWQARQNRQAGAGLGLAIAKGVVEAHGGRIWAESEPGRGTTVAFTLPLDAETVRLRR